MATALPGHIDDRDGLPTRLEDFSPMRPHFPQDQRGLLEGALHAHRAPGM